MVVLASEYGEETRNSRRSLRLSPNGHAQKKSGDDQSPGKASLGPHGKIRVGPDYQVVCPELIPENLRKPKLLVERALLVWSPPTDIPDRKIEDYILLAKDSGYGTEQALGMLFWHKHNLNRAVLDLQNFTPCPDEWSVEDKVLFKRAFQLHGKNFRQIRQMLPQKSIGSLVKYYYSWKKTRSQISELNKQAQDLKMLGDNETSSEGDSESESPEDSDHDDKKPNEDVFLINTAPLHVKIGSKMALTIRRNLPAFQSLKPALLKIQNFCSTCAVIICLILLILSLLAVVFKPLSKVIHVVLIESEKPTYHVTNTRFLSTALDSSLIADNFKNFNMTNPKLLKLMTPLAPAYLRIGGTMADRLWFVSGKTFTFKTHYLTEVDGGECAYENFYCNQLLRPNFTMSESEWLQLNKLASSAGLTIIFDLNCLLRYSNGSWDSRNAEKLIDFSSRHNLNVMWELGNEPNAFKHVFNYEVNATQLAEDFITLRNILNRYPLYEKSLLVGPDTTRPVRNHKESEKYMEKFLERAGQSVNAITWHQYYFNGRTATASDFLNPNIFDLLADQIQIVKDIAKAAGAQAKPIWLGETSSAYGGGAPGYSNRYLATFIWLDKLGLAARFGLDLVIRQSLFKGYYALIDDELEPSPDWWLSVIYKTLVGPEVVPCESMSSHMVRLYCQCTEKRALYNIVPSVTVFGFNMKSTEAKVRLEGIQPALDQHGSKVFAYVLTPYVTLLSKYIRLNDDILYLLPNGNLPPFKPKLVDSKPYLIMPPYSLVFWVVPSPLLRHCHPGTEHMNNL